MLLIFSYLISLGIGQLISAPYYFILNSLYVFKLDRFIVKKNLLIIAFFGLLLSFFYVQNLDQSLTSLSVVLTSFVICNHFIYIKKKKIKIFFRFFSVILISIYVYSYLFFGNRLYAVELIGIGTYNAHFFFLFMSFVLYVLTHDKINFYDLLLLTFVGLLLGGRTNVIISILLPILYFTREKIFLMLIIVSVIFFINNYIYPEMETFLSSYFSDYDEKGFRMGPREILYNCIYSKLNVYDFFLGFDIENKFKLCFVSTIGSRTESSFIQLLGNWGIFGIFWFLYISKFWFNTKYLWVYLLIIFRALSGDFFFFSIFDWILLLPVFKSIFINKSSFIIINLKRISK
jgi:hypothetical protein